MLPTIRRHPRNAGIVTRPDHFPTYYVCSRDHTIVPGRVAPSAYARWCAERFREILDPDLNLPRTDLPTRLALAMSRAVPAQHVLKYHTFPRRLSFRKQRNMKSAQSRKQLQLEVRWQPIGYGYTCNKGTIL